MGYTNAFGWIMNYFTPKDHFMTILWKRPYSSWSFSLLIPKIRPSPTREKCFGVHILGPSLN